MTTKSDFVLSCARRAHLTREALEAALEAIENEIIDLIARGEDVKLQGFGTFYSGRYTVKDRVMPSGQLLPDKVVRTACFRPGDTTRMALRPEKNI